MSQLGNLSPEASVAVGVIVCLLSSGIQSLGLTLQRKSHMLEETQYLDSPRPPYRRRRWQVGFSLFLIANLVGSTIQLSILPLPVLAALQAAGLVFNSINATWILGEDFTRWSFAGTILVGAGAVLIAYFGALPEPAHSLGQLLALFARSQFIAWAAVQVLLILSVFGTIYLIRRLSKSRGQSKSMRLARGMCYGALSGILSAHSLLMAKSAVELLVRTIADGENQFAYWQSWIILIALISIGLSQLYCLHSGLQLCSTSVLYPFVFCVYNVITILDGLIYFNQGSELSGLQTGLIVLGTLILLSGVFCLSWRLAAEDASGPQSPEISENPMSPSVGVAGTPNPSDSWWSGERQPLLSRSPDDSGPEQPFSFRPSRASASKAGSRTDGDEEANVGLMSKSTTYGAAGPAGEEGPGPYKLPRTRKRATFADFGTMQAQHGRARSSTNPLQQLQQQLQRSDRRPSLLSQYARTKSRRMSVAADNQALWGELEEAGGPLEGSRMARSEMYGGARMPATSAGRAGSWRRMSEGSSRLLGGARAARASMAQQESRRASDVGGGGGGGSRGAAGSNAANDTKHGDPGQAIEDDESDGESSDGGGHNHRNSYNNGYRDEDDDDPMASSTPLLLQRSATGRTYRVISAEARRRRSSVPAEGERPGPEARRRWADEEGGGGSGGAWAGRNWDWHTIDASQGRPSDRRGNGRGDEGGNETGRDASDGVLGWARWRRRLFPGR